MVVVQVPVMLQKHLELVKLDRKIFLRLNKNNLGADFVMLGGMLAGHDESGTGEIIERNGRKYKLFYGMSSKTAMDKHVKDLFIYFNFIYWYFLVGWCSRISSIRRQNS